MRRNSGIIGFKNSITQNNGTGIHDTFDIYNYKKLNKWPLMSTVSAVVSVNTTSINEGQQFICTLQTWGLDIGATVSYAIKVSNGNFQGTDFVEATTGTLAIPAGYTSQVSFTANNDTYTEGTEVFYIEFKYNGNIIATTPNVTVNDTSTGTAEPSGLYNFTTFTFTNAGATGRFGPTLSNCTSSYNTSTYPWILDTAYFNVVTQGYQLWTVPITGSYEIEVVGAAGGPGYGTYGTRGYGAKMVSTFALTQGAKLQIIVGQVGGGTATNACGGDGAGGGGSFVFTDTGVCMMAAGGGGGGSYNSFNRDPTLRDAPNSTSGNKGSGSTGGAGGTGGTGGSIQSGSCVPGGGAGAGILTAGAVNGQTFAAASYSQGFTGGQNSSIMGGFGGGGGPGTNYTAGGGGGYSGGGGGGLQTCACNDMGNGGGGGCYSSTTYVYTAQAGTSDGYVKITKV